MQSVYGLVDPRTEEVRYIGIAKDIHKRYAQHLLYPHKNDGKQEWLSELKEAGLIPLLILIEGDIDDNKIFEREKYWIKYYLAQGAKLTNIINTRNLEGKEEPEYTAITSGTIEVFPVEGGYQIFWCPSAPLHFADKVPYIDSKNVKKQGIYKQRQAAYRRKAELNKKLQEKGVSKEVA